MCEQMRVHMSYRQNGGAGTHASLFAWARKTLKLSEMNLSNLPHMQLSCFPVLHLYFKVFKQL